MLGTGPWQYDFYQVLVSTGVSVITVGPSENIFGAEQHIKLDVRSVTQIAKAVAKVCNPIYFFTSQTDVSVVSAAELNNRFNISDANLEASKIFTNKFLMREKNKSSLLKNPKYIKLNIDNLSFDFVCKKYKNFIVKPLNLQSSLGVKELSRLSAEDFLIFKEELHKLKVDEVIIEEKIEGVEYTIEGYKERGGGHKILAASKKEKKIGFGVANSLHYTEECLLDIMQLAPALNDLLSDLSFGPTHSEVIKENSNSFYLVESAVRGGGSSIASKIIPVLTGFYPEQQMLFDATGIKVVNQKLQKFRAVTLAFYAYRHAQNYMVDYSDVKHNVVSHWTDYTAGRPLGKIIDDRSRHGCFIVGGGSSYQVRNILKRISKENENIDLY